MAARRFANALRAYREKAGMKQADLAQKVGVTGPYISMLEGGKRPAPADDVTRAIEKALEVPPGTLLRLAHIERTPEDIRNATGLEALYEKGLLADPEEAKRAAAARAALRPVPLINKVAAGYPADFTDLDYPPGVADEYVGVPDLADPNAFAITVVGDSMVPRFNEGDILIISPAAPVRSGDFCFVRIDRHGEVTSTFKQVFFEGEQTVRLASINPRFGVQSYERQQVSGLYRAVRRLEEL